MIRSRSGKKKRPRPAVAAAATQMFEPHRSARQKFHVAQIPLVTVTLQLIDADARHEALGKPRRRHDLTAVGRSVVEYELTDAREIARCHAQARGGDRFAVALASLPEDPGLLAGGPF